MAAKLSKLKKPKSVKGQKQSQADSVNPEENPLLHIDNKTGFEISTTNLLQEPDALIFEGFESFDLKKDNDHFDLERLNDNSTVVVVLRYYEFICMATVSFSYIIPILQSGMVAKDVFDMLRHCLKNKLLMNVPSFDNIFEPDLHYFGKIRY